MAKKIDSLLPAGNRSVYGIPGHPQSRDNFFLSLHFLYHPSRNLSLWLNLAQVVTGVIILHCEYSMQR